jgi:hypothetical protein
MAIAGLEGFLRRSGVRGLMPEQDVPAQSVQERAPRNSWRTRAILRSDLQLHMVNGLLRSCVANYQSRGSSL